MNSVIRKIKHFNYKSFSSKRQKFFRFLNFLIKTLFNLIFFAIIFLPFALNDKIKDLDQNIFSEPGTLFSICLTVYISTFLTIAITLVLLNDRCTKENEFKLFKKIIIFGFVDIGTIITESLVTLFLAFMMIFVDIKSSMSYSLGLLLYSLIFLSAFLNYALSSEESKFTKKLEIKYIRLQDNKYTKIMSDFVVNWEIGETKSLSTNYDDLLKLDKLFGLLKEGEIIYKLKEAILFNDSEDLRYWFNLTLSYLKRINNKYSVSSFKDLEVLMFIIYTLDIQVFEKAENIKMFSDLINTSIRLEFTNSEYLSKMYKNIKEMQNLNNEEIEKEKASLKIYKNYCNSFLSMLCIILNKIQEMHRKYGNDIDYDSDIKEIETLLKISKEAKSTLDLIELE